MRVQFIVGSFFDVEVDSDGDTIISANDNNGNSFEIVIKKHDELWKRALREDL
jgi:hypothetical protein